MDLSMSRLSSLPITLQEALRQQRLLKVIAGLANLLVATVPATTAATVVL